ncbi:hypothetical protein PsorP6_004890 [Peronosclerospora sorghi]|uniref:Uncharacterized protein n=1 Tax=Peronosclerospora sorghi TaxID=230839 RepID=A0ACC0W780_9STRA|nr:hypothetical protein PsorP6_004890 [Peronosclerospora sorghi]
MAGVETEPFVMDFSSKSQNRNRGNHRYSKCGKPKEGHACPLVPSNYKCNRCGLSRKSCTCVAPTMRTIDVQVEMDEDMTTRVLDLSLQNLIFKVDNAGCHRVPENTCTLCPSFEQCIIKQDSFGDACRRVHLFIASINICILSL